MTTAANEPSAGLTHHDPAAELQGERERADRAEAERDAALRALRIAVYTPSKDDLPSDGGIVWSATGQSGYAARRDGVCLALTTAYSDGTASWYIDPDVKGECATMAEAIDAAHAALTVPSSSNDSVSDVRTEAAADMNAPGFGFPHLPPDDPTAAECNRYSIVKSEWGYVMRWHSRDVPLSAMLGALAWFAEKRPDILAEEGWAGPGAATVREHEKEGG